MTIQIDSREKPKAIRNICYEFTRQGAKYFISKLPCGDYCSLDNAHFCIDRKQNLNELAGNVCQQHQLAVSGERMYKILSTLEARYNTKFYFCTKAQTGKEIIRLLKEGSEYE